MPRAVLPRKRTRKPKIIAVLIAYKAEKTLPSFMRGFPKHLVDELLLVDDASPDRTYALAKQLGIPAYRNPVNLGYGGNMKRALGIALQRGGDIFIDLHPDGEYKPTAIPAALAHIRRGAQFVLGNRFTTATTPLHSGMRLWKFLPIKALAFIDRLVLGVRIHDLHQGFRVYTRPMLARIAFERNSNNYLFSFELIAQAVFHRIPLAEVPVETHYTGKKRGASLKSSIRYSLGTFMILLLFLLAKAGFPIRLFAIPDSPLAVRAKRLARTGNSRAGETR